MAGEPHYIPMTQKILQNREILPNNALRSQIAMAGRVKGETARQKSLKDMLNRIQSCTTSDEVTAALSALSDFVAETRR